MSRTRLGQSPSCPSLAIARFRACSSRRPFGRIALIPASGFKGARSVSRDPQHWSSPVGFVLRAREPRIRAELASVAVTEGTASASER
jgi:hypothetical protein